MDNTTTLIKKHTASIATRCGYEVNHNGTIVGWVAQDAKGRWVPWISKDGPHWNKATKTRNEAVDYTIRHFAH
ncbi:hypothetical protein LCGC14_0319660 [marine sediment metagenome]|uniref:Uncharacterized protein n=1 Tax=marine sediment metagenome TaxID=412755 RepID=A0A0F9WRI0_9ZZZZ